MKAVAMANGSSTTAMKMDDESFAGKHNIAYPYSDLEHTMMQQAFNTIKSKYKFKQLFFHSWYK